MTNKYKLVSDEMQWFQTSTASGTSNATNFIMTLPFNPSEQVISTDGQAVDNGVQVSTWDWYTTPASNQLKFQKSLADAGWTNTGNKYASVKGTVKIS